MFNYVLYYTIAGSTVIIMAIGILLGSWLIFKGSRSIQTGEDFIGRKPKGEVFSVTDGLDEPDFPGESSQEEKHILEKTNDFLKSFKG